RVRAVDYNLPHKVDFAHRLRTQEERDLQRDVQGLRVGRMGRLFVRLDEADVGRRLVHEGQPAFRLLDGGRIDLAELRLRGPLPSAESESAGRGDEGRRVFAEQLVGRGLVVDLEADLQTKCAVVQRVWKPAPGLKPSLRAGR